MEKSNEETLKKLKGLIEEVKVCMMITKNENGRLNARPMSNVKV